jgi:hypothetical protein
MAQSLDKQVAGTSDLNGAATFTFQSPPTGFWWTGTLNCPAAPTGAIFQAKMGATQWGEWGGNSVYGPVQAQPNRQLVVTATGLLPNTGYVLTWLGSEQTSREAEVVYPSANSTALTALTTPAVAQQLYSTPSPVTVPFTQSVALTPGIRTLVIQAETVSATYPGFFYLEVVGEVSGFSYYTGTFYLFVPTGNSALAVVPISPAIDNSVSITLLEQGGSVLNFLVTVYGDTSIYDESVFYNGQAVTASVVQPTSGTYKLIDGPARIISATLDLDNAEGYMLWTDPSGTTHRMMHIVSSTTANPGLTQAFTPNTLLPIGASIKAVMATATGAHAINASVTYAYP